MSPLIRCYPGDRALGSSLAVALAVALASGAAWLLSRRLAGNAALRHLVLLSALVCCLASPAAAWFCAATGLALVSIPLLRSEQAGTALGVTPAETDPAWTPPRQPADPPPAAARPSLPPTGTTSDQEADTAAAPSGDESPAAPAPPAPDVAPAGGPAGTLAPFRGIATGVMFAWAAGALLMLARLARNCGRVVRLRRSARWHDDAAHQLLLREVAARLGMRRVPLLLVSGRTAAPLAVGFGRPAVVLPERLLGAVSADELRDVLVHEVAHLRRGDQWIVLLQELAGALYWPIVSVHALNRELRRAREELCDNVVLAGRDAIRYGETLLHVAELVVEARPTGAAVGILGGQGTLERRIAGLIDPRRKTMTTTSRRAACVVMALFIAWGAVASATRLAAPAVADEPGPAAQKPPSDPDPDDPKFAGHFSGRVTGADGKPLGGARVYIARFYGEPRAPGPVRAETGADGRFDFDAPDLTYAELDGLPARREGLLVVTKDGYALDWFHTWGQDHEGLYEHWDPVKGAALNLQLARDDVPIHGRFLDPDGRPLAGARVRLTRLMIPRDRDLSAHLAKWSRASVDSGFLTPVPDYERELYYLDLVPGLTTETRTDADGRFTMSGLGRDRLAELSVSAASVVDTTLTVMTRDGPDVGTFVDFDGKPTHVIHGAGFTLKLERGLTVKGRVIDRDTRKPIAGMWVGPLQNAVNEFSSRLYPWVTDEDGRFTITGLDLGFLKSDRIYRLIVAATTPGLPYETAWAEAKGDGDVVIECRRGIPFRLKLVDEQGRPVEAKVTYVDVQPNADAVRDEVIWPVSWAARRPDGTYEGFVLPGPGAVLVKTKWSLGYRPAHVDPKAFFAPGRTNWTEEEQTSAYGTQDTLTTSNGRYIGTVYRGSTVDQRDYTAIVLVNPPAKSGPLQLSATVVRDRPRGVLLVDPDGRPVVGAQTWSVWVNSLWQREGMPLRTASFPLTGLHPDRVTPLKFVKEDRKLVALLLARGDGVTPYTVTMQPWGTVTGRILDENGKPVSDAHVSVIAEGTGFSVRTGGDTDANGRFSAEEVIPGLSYTAKVSRGGPPLFAKFAGTLDEKLTLRPGEVRDLGDLPIRPPANGK